MKKLDIARNAALLAGQEIMATRASAIKQVSFKTPKDLVTPADLAAEKIIIESIRKNFPLDAVLAEESSPAYTNQAVMHGPIWIIDPIDGTTNFAHQHPHCCISIAYAEDGLVQFGVVHAPFYNETFHAVRDGGAFLNDQPIKIRPIEELKDALIATGFVYRQATHTQVMSQLARVVAASRDVRRIGAAALDISWVACGRLDAFYESPLSPWDVAAARLIATEAGARAGFVDGPGPNEVVPEEFFAKDIIISSPIIFDQLRSVLRGE